MRSPGPRFLKALPLLAAACLGTALAQDLVLRDPVLRTDGAFEIRFTPPAGHYFILRRGTDPAAVHAPVAVALAPGDGGVLADPDRTAATRRFYRVEAVPWDSPRDLDRDGLDDLFELFHPAALDALDPSDAAGDADADGFLNHEEAAGGTDPTDPASRPRVGVAVLPRNGETGVSVHREVMVRFDKPLAAGTTIDGNRFFAGFGGRRILARTALSDDRTRAWLFPLEPVPAGARIRVVFEASGLLDASGREIDGDGDGMPGGTLESAYETFGATPVPGTAVVGRVVDSEPVPDGTGGFTNRPLAGVIITVDGAEQTLRATTDATGRFRLDPAPAGRFFVHVDGRNAAGSSWPGGAYYPFIGKAWEAIPGRTNNPAGGTGIIHLPRIAAGTLRTVSATADTVVGFPPAILAAQPALEGVQVTVPANSLFADNGTRGGRVGIAPVPPDRLPEPLPAGLALPLVITVQTDGPMNFDRPAPVRFPNLPDPVTGELLPPGARTVLWSFDHDTGRWEPQGLMTVSADGRFAVTDPGVGITQPGWHGTSPSCPLSQKAPCEADLATLKNALKLAKAAANCAKDVSSIGRILSLGANLGEIAPRLHRNVRDFRELYSGGSLTRAQAANLLSTIKSLKSALLDLKSLILSQNPAGKMISLVNCLAELAKAATDIGCGTYSCQSAAADRICRTIQPVVNAAADIARRLEKLLDGALKRVDVVCLSLDLAINALQVRYGPLDEGARLAAGDPDELLAVDPEVVQLLDAVLLDIEALIAETGAEKEPIAAVLVPLTGLESALTDEKAISKLLIASGAHIGARYHFRYERAGVVVEERLPFGDVFERMVPLGQNGTLSWYHPETGLLGSMEWVATDAEQAALSPAALLPPVWLGSPPREHQVACEAAAAACRDSSPPELHPACGAACKGVPGWIPYQVRFADIDALPDGDGDGLPDLAETIYGTNPIQADTDGDGIPDGVEAKLGMDPSAEIVLPLGVIAALDTDGTAADLAAHERHTVIADGSGGLVVMRVDGLNLTRVAVVPTPGPVRAVAVDGHLAVGGDQSGFLTVLDLARPDAELAQPVGRIPLGSRIWGVAAARPVAFAALDSGILAAVHAGSGIVLDRRQVADVHVEDVVVSGGHVHALAGFRVHTFTWDGHRLRQAGSVPAPSRTTPPSSGRGRLFADAHTLLVAQRTDFHVMRPSDGVPVLIHQARPGEGDWKHLITPDGARGFGAVGLNVGATPADDHVSLYAIAPPEGPPSFVATFPTPGATLAVLSRQGLVLTADNLAGLQVLNVNPADPTGIPPEVALRTGGNVAGIDPDHWLEIVAEASDNVAIREVEFLVDGERVYTDTSHPFIHRLAPPHTGPDVVVTARAVDVGGNARISQALVVPVQTAASGPVLIASSPAAGDPAGALREVVLLFDSPPAAGTVSSNSVILRGAGPDGQFDTGDDTAPASGGQEIRAEGDLLRILLAAPLPAGRYRIEVSSGITDPAGNAVQVPFAPTFRVGGPAGMTDMADGDGDELPDAWETATGSDPQKADSDGDGLPDGLEDLDGDGLTALAELWAGTDPAVADAGSDADRDALGAGRERQLGTDPALADTDGDGWNDEAEIAAGSHPLDPRSRPWVFGGGARAAVARPAWDSGAGQFGAGRPVGIARPTFEPGTAASAGTFRGEPILELQRNAP